MSCPIQSAFNALNPPPRDVQLRDNVLSVREYDESTILGFKTIRLQKNNWTAMYSAKYIKEVSYENLVLMYMERRFPC